MMYIQCLLKAEVFNDLAMVLIFERLLNLIVVETIIPSFEPRLKNLKTQMCLDFYCDLLRV